MPRALIIHATDLLVRGALTLSPGRTTAQGDPTHALYGVIRGLRAGIEFKEPEVAVAIIDTAPVPKELASQSAAMPPLFQAHGIESVQAEDPAELVASYTAAALEAGHDVVVVGADKRLAQLVGDDVWWYDAYKDVRYTPELVRKRFEVLPEFVAGWLALVGDDDTLPGVKGIGKKGAAGLVEDFGSVAAAVERADEVEGRTGKALRAVLEDVHRELPRATLRRDRSLPRPVDNLRYRAADGGALQERYGDLGFFEFLESDGPAAPVEICDSDAKVQAAVARLTEAPVSVEALIEDPSPPIGELVGLAFSQGDFAFYVPVATDAPLEASLRSFLADQDRPKLGHDVKTAVVALARRGEVLAGVVGDSGFASHLHEPSNLAPHDLTLLAKHVLRRALPEEDEVRGVGKRRKQWRKVSGKKAAAYAGAVARAAASVWDTLAPTTDPDLLQEYFALSKVLVRMEQRGIGCDKADLEAAGDDFTRIGKELEEEIFQLVGKRFNLGSTKQLGSVLFEDLELPILKRTKTGWSTANEALERIEHAHPVVPLVIRSRRLRRLKDNWVTALSALISEDGRVHSTFHPARSFSGRLVNSTPDLGRVPGKTPEMARIRHAFCAPKGSVLLSVDYSQLGLYVLAHLTKDPALVEPLTAQDDMHTLTAMAVLELPREKIEKRERQIGKVVNFATFAGQGAGALRLQLGVTPAEAKEIIARFNKRYAVVREFQDRQFELASTQGHIVTIAGRRWPIGDLNSPDQTMRSYAERLARRATHEGSVADVSRRGLLRAAEALQAAGLRAEPLLQVHDEVLFEVPEAELEDAARVAADAMRHAYPLQVPLRVGCKAGPNWADLEPLGA